MRDPDRLDKCYNEILDIHKKIFPDWRISQFIINFLTWHMNTYKTDGFYVEEKEFVKRINEFAIEITRW